MDEIRTEWLMTLPRITELLAKGLLMYQSSPGFCWCLLQRKTVYFENSDNTLTQFGRFMLLTNHHNVCKNVYFTLLNQTLLKGEIDPSRRAVSV